MFEESLGLIGGNTEEMPIERSAAGAVKPLFSLEPRSILGGKLPGALGRNSGRGGGESNGNPI